LTQSIFTVIVYRQVFTCRKLLHGLKTFSEFPVGMDIGIIEIAVHFYALTLQDLKWISSAGAAADVE
jgi:hypothetical protein